MTDIIFSSIVVDLKSALETNNHPFRYFTLATSDINGTPRLRTVVLRNVDNDLNLTFYTDQRSKKVTHLREKKLVSLLFYDPERLLQITIKAKAQIITNDEILSAIWKEIPQNLKKEYTTELSPGNEIKSPDEVDYLEGKHFFSAIQLIPERIEYLRLQRPNHTRALFKKKNGDWVGKFLVP